VTHGSTTSVPGAHTLHGGWVALLLAANFRAAIFFVACCTPCTPPAITLGQPADQVTASFGQPLTVARLGVKVIYYYLDMKVIQANGKVSNVQ